MCSIGEEISDEDVKEMICEADPRKEGRVSYKVSKDADSGPFEMLFGQN
jgi:Ca2+-binding EF-hand superfamily protein